ncbi:hypothetical protein PBV87_15765 [Niameybacter massiliensis]|uniref:Uncharacterized protein n=1 Tax=Holtiella tumoricola TaxID=3018743 RepID=A0AA42J287_9FIRM|nr:MULTISPECIES: hypothetical protein [Lachnospirales]MDA3732933.1 hypothetical protein [Holtiella tumoricola]
MKIKFILWVICYFKKNINSILGHHIINTDKDHEHYSYSIGEQQNNSLEAQIIIDRQRLI